MTRFYVLDYDPSGKRGTPPYIDGVITEYTDIWWNEYSPDAAEHYRDQAPFNLRTKHRLIDVDYADVHSLFIASERFVERLTGAACSFVTRPLRVWAGKNEMTQKRFFLLRVLDRFWCMDTERSEYRVNVDPKTGAPRYRPWAPGQPTYSHVARLVIDEAKTAGKDLFFCEEAFRHIVSDRLADRLSDLNGVRLTPTAEYQFPVV
jgi:hypothetical protein